MEITLSDLKELIGSAGATEAPITPLAPEGSRVILVMQRGWVAVGNIHHRGSLVELSDAVIVRRWGTTKGLGQLAAEGPQPGTTLDPCPFGISTHVLAVVACFPCSPGRGWNSR